MRLCLLQALRLNGSACVWQGLMWVLRCWPCGIRLLWAAERLRLWAGLHQLLHPRQLSQQADGLPQVCHILCQRAVGCRRASCIKQLITWRKSTASFAERCCAVCLAM